MTRRRHYRTKPNPKTLRPGQWLTIHGKRHRVEVVNRFFHGGRLLGGGVYLTSTPPAEEPRDLFELCDVARLPRMPKQAVAAMELAQRMRAR